MSQVAPRFARVESYRNAPDLVTGLMSDLSQKGCWTIAKASENVPSFSSATVERRLTCSTPRATTGAVTGTLPNCGAWCSPSRISLGSRDHGDGHSTDLRVPRMTQFSKCAPVSTHPSAPGHSPCRAQCRAWELS